MTIVEHYGSSISAYENRGATGPVIDFHGSAFSGIFSMGDHNKIRQTNSGAGGSELADLLAAVIEAAKGTEVEDRVGRLVTQLGLEADEEEPDQTIVGKTLDRLQDTASTEVGQAAGKGLAYAVTRLAQWCYEHGISQATGAA